MFPILISSFNVGASTTFVLPPPRHALLIAGALSVWTMTAQSRAKDAQGSMPLSNAE
jgi:hypothetical protein